MGVLELRIDPQKRFGLLNPDHVAQELRKSFPEATASVEDALLAGVMQLFSARSPADLDEHTLDVLTRRLLYGPEYRFSLAFTEGRTVKGYIDRRLVAFLYEEPLEADLEDVCEDSLKASGPE
jgi:hypothetical protein